MNGFLFLLYAPIIAPIAGLIGGIIATIIHDSKTSSSSIKPGTKPASSPESSLYRGCGNPSSLHDYDIHGYGYNSLSSLESEMRAHNARMEQMMREQEGIMIENELRRVNESIRKPLAEQFDGRLTNIFKNPWEGIL